ncbi:MAG: class I SAM-dependent methyltransferase [Alphaproteobacteria bacterium]
MTENVAVRYVETGSARLDDFEIERLHEEFATEMVRAGIGSGARILEIGYGHGHFLDWAKARGCTVTGTEINPGLHDAAAARGHDVHLGTLDQVSLPADIRYDAVVAFDVFEHLTVDELKSSLETLHRLLNDTGVVFARFPNGGSPFGLAFQSGDITHKTALNESAMEQLGDITGFDVGFCGNAARTVSGRKAKLLKRLAFKFCDVIEIAVGFLYFRGRRMPLDVNLACVLRKR